MTKLNFEMPEISDDQKEVILYGLANAVMTGTAFFKARRAAKAGNYSKGTYYLVMWLGFNLNGAIGLRDLKERQEKRKDARVLRKWTQEVDKSSLN